ncbi:hypothetical protein [Escherichia coli]|uniref:hypothetical protein n=1 Tax=Escherichia coli TaxID=562 RepID=UPI003C305347
MPLWQGWNWRDGNFGGSGLQPLPESRFNRLTLSVLAAVGRWDYINDIIRRIDRDRGDAATLIALADHIRTNRPERDL